MTSSGEPWYSAGGLCVLWMPCVAVTSKRNRCCTWSYVIASDCCPLTQLPRMDQDYDLEALQAVSAIDSKDVSSSSKNSPASDPNIQARVSCNDHDIQVMLTTFHTS